MERPFEHTSQELLEGFITQTEESLEHLISYAKQELQLRLAAVALDDSRNERLATIRERIALIYETDSTGVYDALSGDLPSNPCEARVQWAVELDDESNYIRGNN